MVNRKSLFDRTTRGSRPGETVGTGITRLTDQPSKLLLELRRLASIPLNRLYFSIMGVRWGNGWRLYGRPRLQRHRGSTITIGDRVHLRSWPFSNPLTVHHRVALTTWSTDARIEIGNGVGMTGTTICAQESVTIGDGVRIGANCTISDTDFHPLDMSRRLATREDGKARAITIGDGAFIGMETLVLKGVTIGEGAIIGAGSVVVRDVASHSVVAGNPAVVVRDAV